VLFATPFSAIGAEKQGGFQIFLTYNLSGITGLRTKTACPLFTTTPMQGMLLPDELEIT
jgi:hypothetical protein